MFPSLEDVVAEAPHPVAGQFAAGYVTPICTPRTFYFSRSRPHRIRFIRKRELHYYMFHPDSYGSFSVPGYFNIDKALAEMRMPAACNDFSSPFASVVGTPSARLRTVDLDSCCPCASLTASLLESFRSFSQEAADR